tara:strand:+ start:3194 stop:3406 length:213 start_codon:yes stop_codon:yes gene_type:complete
MKKPLIRLVVLLLVGLSAWGLTHIEHGHVTWAKLIEPLHVFSLVGVVGTILGSWYSDPKGKGKSTSKEPK